MACEFWRTRWHSLLHKDAQLNKQKAIRSSRIITPDGVRPGTVIISHGKILAVTADSEDLADTQTYDVGDHMVLPGLVDAHAHLNEPGRTEWEGFATGTKAAAAGGYTTIVDMPLNCIPSTTTVSALDGKRAAVEGKAFVDYAFWAGVVPDNTSDLRALAQAGVRGFKCFLIHPGTDEFAMVTEADLREAMPAIAETGLPLLVHAELPQAVAEAARKLEGSNWRAYGTYLQSRPESAEVEAIRLIIRLAHETKCRVHIVHLSAAAALADLEAARQGNLPITVETCPHYLYFDAEEILDGATQFKCAPPIRSALNQARLWEALYSGQIDMIATDHSPCPPELKCLEEGDFRKAWGGISSLSVSLPAIWTAVRERGFRMTDVIRWMAERPAKLAGFDRVKGCIAPGYDADLVVFNPDATFVVGQDDLHFRHPCSPYLGERMQGQVQSTLLRGEVVYQHGQFSNTATGTELTV
jgi:allantoinase